MIVQFLVALVATVSFAVLYDAPQKELLFSGLSGAVGWVVYLYLVEEMQVNKVISCVAATLILTLIARILAVARCCPVTVYLLVSIFPLVPGTGIYYTSYYLITRQNSLFAATGLATFETAAAIAFGIAMGFGLPQSWFGIFQRRKKLERKDTKN
ncbi:MAG: threonine/serine exporter family protein [Lachnospiraceae bacterium]|nr:threonine/serine exporter family protein [Lachnospiraceae bacterium]